jgi:hypothetical protein
MGAHRVFVNDKIEPHAFLALGQMGVRWLTLKVNSRARQESPAWSIDDWSLVTVLGPPPKDPDDDDDEDEEDDEDDEDDEDEGEEEPAVVREPDE